MINRKYLLIIIIFSLRLNIFPQELDNFDSEEGWNIYKSDGVEAEISIDEGYRGKGIRFDYNFIKGTGYGGIQKLIHLDLPENYQFTFYLKAESPGNNFEFKLLDSTGQNVWWVNNINYSFPSGWTKIKIKKRHINFAWGPAEDKSLREINRLEFTIASYVGGRGTIWIDELKFEPLPPEDNSPIIPEVSASTELNSDLRIGNVVDSNVYTQWKSSSDEKQEVILSLGKQRELGGIVIEWDKQDYAEEFDIYLSSGNMEWDKVYSVKNAGGRKSYIRLKEENASDIKVDLLKSSRSNGYGIREINIKNADYSSDLNRFFINIAKDYPRGYFPRYFYEEGTFWTIVGSNNLIKEALINEDGMVEVDKKSFSIEPFISLDRKFITWNDVKKEQSLEKNFLPIPTVIWDYDGLQLQTSISAEGESNISSNLCLKYKLTNNSSGNKKGKLYLAIRPFQVNPYYQWLNIIGGVSGISSIRYNDGKIYVNNDKIIVPLTRVDGFGAAEFDEGDITAFLSEDRIPESKEVADQKGLASGCLSYSFDLKKGEEKIVTLAVPFFTDETGNQVLQLEKHGYQSQTYVSVSREISANYWEKKVSHIKFNLPASADKIINTWKSILAYILINKDNAGIQPGSRSYERSWMRDGALTSSALLKSGITEEVREYIDWFSSFQYENGKVPCVVDSRGPDPTPENDSHGQLIYLIREYFNFTKDTSFLKSKNENVKKAVSYLEELISQRTTDEYKKDTLKPYYGILPESISHEGYSAKPMHSFWDDFFALKGLKDAVEIQRVIGGNETYKSFVSVRDEFKKNLYNSIKLAIEKEKIDYIPGCVELGDFDATSTTIALSPCNELQNLPQPYAQNTFDKYFEFFRNRRDKKTDWTNYTPYENRLIGSFIFLDQPERAHELLDFFLNDQKPLNWNHWAEVVWNNERHPGFIGDMPHTWVGSDFINAVRSIFVYENEYDSTLVAGAALYQDWIDSPEGMSVEYLPTYYGKLSYSVKKDKNKYTVKFYGNISLPSGGIVLKNFNGSRLPVKVIVNEKETKEYGRNKIIIREFPAEVNVFY